MPPQKNTGNKGAKRETGVSMKNRKFVQSFFDDIRNEGSVADVYVSRILKKMGNGRVEAFYVDSEKKPQTVQAVIRGSFRGKGKRSVWIEDNAIVIIADSGIGGSAEFEIVAVLSPEQLRDLRKEMEIDPRVTAFEVVDTEILMSDKPIDEGGFEFETPEEPELTENQIDDI
jgi:hypothetical protein